MLKSYLPSRYNTWTAILVAFLVFWGKFKIAFIILIFYIIAYFILRKNSNRFRDDPVVTKGVVFSPANGKIVYIEKNVSHVLYGEGLTEIQILIPWWKEMGIYLPVSSEIVNLIIHKGKAFFRYFKAFEKVGTQVGKGLSIILESRGDIVGITFYKCVLGMWPEILVMPGDRGGRRVNIGYFPFGGTLMLYLPQKYEILINNNEEVVAGETIVAVLQE